ncbi:acyl-CoA dehydrogenase family protein [Idiomarina xiamenensis]|uniref:Acyl-CoA dehydrogenase domain-containing protein n=1 Tax=Idiomarina xiamenensis 10-D-4 TaxID=740709 RepID=K2KT91_9GAMM|nr:acyl-CoA dehydrogenase family protein [Idiomarina xiamenensis]EKE80860.1 acyl-CoA dehydrogenase domain-containing protein [Idiomarina xiamenensis 10-D-4]
MNKINEVEARRDEFRAFTREFVSPYATQHDNEERIADHIVPDLAKRGYLAPFISQKWGGEGMDMITLGMLHEEIGCGCSSVRSLLTVHGMSAFALNRWGSDALKEKWLSALVRGEKIGGFALSEPNAGSDVSGIEMTATVHEDGFLLNGTKKWITFGQIGDVFILMAKAEQGFTAFVVEKDMPGLTIEPILGMTGTRGSMLAQLNFKDYFVHQDNVLASPAFGNVVMLSTLVFGRFSVASGSVGIIQASMDAVIEYSVRVQRFGKPLYKHQLVAQMITKMLSDLTASRLLCRNAGELLDKADPSDIQAVFLAKYLASTSAVRAAADAVQIHGANGCTDKYPVERLLRDAKVMEIIEGSTQILEEKIADIELQSYEQRDGK